MAFRHESIKECREEMGISQEKLLVELGKRGRMLSRPTLAKIEAGKTVPDVDTFMAFKDIFGKPFKVFFTQLHN